MEGGTGCVRPDEPPAGASIPKRTPQRPARRDRSPARDACDRRAADRTPSHSRRSGDPPRRTRMSRSPSPGRTSVLRRSIPNERGNRSRPRARRERARPNRGEMAGRAAIREVAYESAIRRFNGEAMPHVEIEITPQTNIQELVAQLPIAAEVMTAFGLGCSGCWSASTRRSSKARARTACEPSRSLRLSNRRASPALFR